MGLTGIIFLANALIDLAIKIYVAIAENPETPEELRAKLIPALDELRKTRDAVASVEL